MPPPATRRRPPTWPRSTTTTRRRRTLGRKTDATADRPAPTSQVRRSDTLPSVRSFSQIAGRIDADAPSRPATRDRSPAAPARSHRQRAASTQIASAQAARRSKSDDGDRTGHTSRPASRASGRAPVAPATGRHARQRRSTAVPNVDAPALAVEPRGQAARWATARGRPRRKTTPPLGPRSETAPGPRPRPGRPPPTPALQLDVQKARRPDSMVSARVARDARARQQATRRRSERPWTRPGWVMATNRMPSRKPPLQAPTSQAGRARAEKAARFRGPRRTPRGGERNGRSPPALPLEDAAIPRWSLGLKRAVPGGTIETAGTTDAGGREPDVVGRQGRRPSMPRQQNDGQVTAGSPVASA